ncbi:pseudouridine synthase [uncultured Corynebacterium sp.]|uniref:pseudouridine synthase n=1 Tax=uncultured Corynebacterium sp. TaxID=159447 RepID=UPI0025EE1EC0|nr:pseudouridine synthase [uncultured Corynebacterium sp.]
MTEELILRHPALPVVDGLNPSRVRLETATSAAAAVRHLIETQHHHDPDDDAEALYERFRRGEVRRDDGTVLQPSDTVPGGEFIWFYRRPAPERPVPGELRLLYRDENILVADKPPFMSTLPRGQHITETAVVRARRQFGIDDLSPVHRLDRLTRGVLLFTVRREVRGAYQQLFERRLVRKPYEAVTSRPGNWAAAGDTEGYRVPAGALHYGSPAQHLSAPTTASPWVLRHRLVKDRGRLATYVTEGVTNSETDVIGIRPGGTGGGQLVWTLRPRSGRTHQLRVNMRLFGTPIHDDPIYTDISDRALYDPTAPLPFVPAVEDEDFGRPMGLTALGLSFTDPISGEPRTFRSSYRG